MNEIGHTKGPLYARQDSTGAWVVQVGPDKYDQTLAYIGTNNPHVADGSAKGNAMLYAAAPDMLAALKNIENDDAHMPSTAWDLIQAAIAKAEGNQ